MDNNTYDAIKTNFQNNYLKYIKPNLDKYEEKRLKYNKIFFKILTPMVIMLSIALFFNQGLEPFAIMLIAALFPIYFGFEKKLENEIKKEFMPQICKCFPCLNWSKEGHSPSNEFHKIGLVNYYNEENFDDIFYGHYEDISFKIIEADLAYINKLGKKRTKTRVLKGVILKIKVPNSYESHTVIRPDSIFKFIGLDLKRTELEDVFFEKKYDVYTNDEVKSRVTITTVLMDRLNRIEKIFESKKTSCCFIDNCAYVALDTGHDMFKICSIKKPINDSQYFVKIFEEIVSIYNLIDYLKITSGNT